MPRLAYFLLAIATMFLGLVSRSSVVALPEFVATYAGDTLWAMLVFWLARAAKPAAPIKYSAILAIIFAFAIEFSQFYQAPWINSIRATTLGGLVLGYGFKLSDLVCYSIGVFVGFALDVLVIRKIVSDGQFTRESS